MAAARMQPPARGKPYYDADRGRTMILPAGGGKAVPYVGGDGPPKFDPGKALRRSGMQARTLGRELARDAGDTAAAVAARQPFNVGAFGGFIVTAAAGLLGLIVLDLLLRRPAAFELALTGVSRGVRMLVDPHDPIIARGPSTPTPAASGSAFGPGGTYQPPVPGVLPAPGATTVPQPQPTGKLTKVPGTGESIDRAYVGLTRWIAETFGVTLTSGYRTPAENAATNGAPNSDHLRGAAADFAGPAENLARLARWAKAQAFPYVEYDLVPATARGVPTDHDEHVHISFSRP